MFFSTLYSAVWHTRFTLCNKQRQGPLYLKDVCADARLPRALSCTSTVIGCISEEHNIHSRHERSGVQSINSRDLRGNWCVFRLTIQEKDPAEKSVKENLEHVKKALLCIKFQSVFLDGREGTTSNHLNIVAMHLAFVSEQIPLVMCCTFMSAPHGLCFSALGCCRLWNETSCHAAKPSAVWKLPPSSL